MKAYSDIETRAHKNPIGFEISWAGANPVGDGFCFGSENGLLQLMDNNIRPISQVVKASVTGDAINSVTGAGTWMAASTRREITFIGKAKRDAEPEIFQLPFGAYHLERTSSGYIVAAVGRTGLVFVDTKSPKEQISAISPSSNNEMFAYSVLPLPSVGGNEVIVCAGRTSGIMFCEWRPDRPQTTMEAMTFANLDVVDVCSIATNQATRAIAGVGIDGSVILSHDVRNDKKPITMKFAAIRGVAYRVVCCKGHLFVLTSEGLLVLWNLAKDFTERIKTKTFDTSNMMIPMKPVDLNLVNNRYLAVVTIDGIEVIDIDSISGPDSQNGKKPIASTETEDDRVIRMEWESEIPEWKSEGVAVGV